MANEEQLSILRQGVEVWNKWKEENEELISFAETDLRSIPLQGVDFSDVYLTRVNLSGADLSGAYLDGARLYGADCSKSNLSDINFSEVIFDHANLSDANLTNGSFYGARFINSNLRGTLMSRAQIGETIFADVDLSLTLGLEDVNHLAPSIISIGTVKISKGKIPVAFLRGCGLSDLEIDLVELAAPSLDVNQLTETVNRIYHIHTSTSQYYSCFISYSSRNQGFAERLHNDLQNNSVRCWFAPEDMKIGDQIRPRIDQEIRLRDKLLVILSENSVKSEWVGDEVEGALEEESKSNRLVLFPIRLDDTVMNTRDDWAAKIRRRRQIGDFSNWKDKASYQKAFERLLRDLKATGGS